MRLCSLSPVKYGDWYIKGSVMDDQILLVGTGVDNYNSFIKVFYTEDDARKFMNTLRPKKPKTVK